MAESALLNKAPIASDESSPPAAIMQWMPDGWKPTAVAVDIDGTITDYNKITFEVIESPDS